MRDLIINTPSVLNLRQKSNTAFFTFVFWVLWFYLWIPLTTFVGWYLGFDLVHFQIIELERNATFIQELYFFGKVLLAFGVSFGTWVAYNYYRFRDVERRHQALYITTEEMARYFNVNLSKLGEHQTAKYVSVCFDEEGNIVNHTALNLIDKKKLSEPTNVIPINPVALAKK